MTGRSGKYNSTVENRFLKLFNTIDRTSFKDVLILKTKTEGGVCCRVLI
jgi:hypothetical protein